MVVEVGGVKLTACQCLHLLNHLVLDIVRNQSKQITSIMRVLLIGKGKQKYSEDLRETEKIRFVDFRVSEIMLKLYKAAVGIKKESWRFMFIFSPNTRTKQPF